MSSTNRSNARDEHVADYYVTPIKDIELFLNNLDRDGVNNDIVDKFKNGKILDCCAGGNNEIKDEFGIKEVFHPMSYSTAIKNVFDSDVDTYDIREDSLAENKLDYLKTKLDYKPDIIITNPPFNIATSIIEKAIDDVKDGGYVIMLLRLNFFGSKYRKEFFDKYMPEFCFCHRERMSFVDKKTKDGYIEFNKSGEPKRGSTDSIEYAHFVFRKGYKPNYTKLFII